LLLFYKNRFPTDSAQKQKWMSVFGLLSVTNSATLCSDHFNPNQFHQTDGYTRVKRLVPGAVPFNSNSCVKLNVQLENDKPNIDGSTSERNENCSGNIHIERISDEYFESQCDCTSPLIVPKQKGPDENVPDEIVSISSNADVEGQKCNR